MGRYASVAGAVFAFFATTWLVVEALNVRAVVNRDASLDRDGGRAALLGRGLLVADAILPGPSSTNCDCISDPSCWPPAFACATA